MKLSVLDIGHVPSKSVIAEISKNYIQPSEDLKSGTENKVVPVPIQYNG